MVLTPLRPRRIMTAVIPDKRFFRIAEVSRIVGVPTHVLRYWEREFSVVRPLRTPSNQRLYRRDDILMLLEIKTLLYQEHYTIAGARKKLAASRRAGADDLEVIDSIRHELVALRRLLE
jgi:DNA-binding transcriptional MerR regulator